MSMLPTILPDVPAGVNAVSRQMRERRTDSLIAENRQNTPPEVAEQREVRRMSISELNAMDHEEIQKRFLRSKPDRRPPVIKALDMIDLPRNAIANVIFRGAAKTQGDKGETATFGLPRVYFSDALEEMGVENRVVRGVVGFVGDVAMDPLTYLGPAGWGVEAATKSGHVVRMGSRFRRAAKGASRAVGRGQPVTNPELRRAFQAGGVIGKDGTYRTGAKFDTAARALGKPVSVWTPDEIQAYAQRYLHGAISRPEGSVRKAGSYLYTGIGGDVRAKGGAIGRLYGAALKGASSARQEEILAVGDLVAKMGKAASPGPALGGRGSQIAHLPGPWKEYGLNVPAFSRAGRMAVADSVIAGKNVAAESMNSSVVNAVQRVETEVVARAAQHSELSEEIHDLKAQYAQALETGADTSEISKLKDAKTEEMKLIRVEVGMLDNRAKATILNASDSPPDDTASVSALLHAGEATERTRANGVRLAVEAETAFEDVRVARALTKERDAFLGGVKASHEAEVGVWAWNDVEKIIEDEFPGLLRPGQRGKSLRGFVPDELRKAVAYYDGEDDSLRLLGRVYAEKLDDEFIKSGDEIVRVQANDLRIGDEFTVAGGDDAVVRTIDENGRVVIDVSEEGFDVGVDAASIETRTYAINPDKPVPIDAESWVRRGEPVQPALADRLGAAEASYLESARAKNESVAAYLDLSGDDIVRNEELAQSVQMRADAAYQVAHAQRGSVMHYVSGGDKELATAARHAFGMSEDVMGGALFAPVESVAKYVFGPDEEARRLQRLAEWERMLRPYGGRRDTELHRNIVRRLRSKDNVQRQVHVNEAAGAILTDIDNALRESELPFTQANRSDLGKLVNARTHQIAAGKVDKSYFLSRFNKDAPPPGVGVLADDAQPTEFFSFVDNHALMNNERLSERVDEMAQRAYAAYQDIREKEIAAKVAARVESVTAPESIIPRSLSETAKRAQRIVAASIPDTAKSMGRGGQKAKTLAREISDKMRTVKEYRYYHPEKEQWVRFFSTDEFALGQMTKRQLSDLALHRPEIAELVDDIKFYNEGLTPEQRTIEFAPREADPFEMAVLRQTEQEEGKHSLLTNLLGGATDLGADNLYELELTKTLSDRIAQYHSKIEGKKLQDMLTSRGVAVHPEQLVIEVDGAPLKAGMPAKANRMITLADGTKAQLVTGKQRLGKEPAVFVIIDGQRYRTLRSGTATDPSNPLLADYLQDFSQTGQQRQVNDLLLHEHMAEAVEEYSGIFDSETAFSGALDVLDKVTSFWKTQVLMHTSWILQNVIGDGMLAFMAGFRNPAIIATHGKPVVRALMQRNNPEELAKLSVTIRGQKTSMMSLLRDMFKLGVVDDTFFGEAILHGVRSGTMVFPTDPRAVSRTLGTNIEAMKTNLGAAGEALRTAAGKAPRQRATGTVAAGAQAGMTIARDGVWRNLVTPWFASNMLLQNWMRAMTYISILEKGTSPTAAAGEVIRRMYNYSDLSKHEIAMRRVFPFYAWLRNNTIHMTKVMLERPRFFNAVPKFRQAIEETIAGEEAMPLNARPNWMLEAQAIQIGKDPEKRWGVLVGNLLPQEQMSQLMTITGGAKGFESFMHYVGSNISPVIRAPFELASGRETFTKRELSADPLYGDINWTEYLAGQVRWLREFGVGSPRQGAVPRAFERGFGAGVGRVIIGGRAQPMDADRMRWAKSREFQEAEKAIRSKIRLAAREGKAKLRIKAEVALMALYQDMEKAGFNPPKWASGALETMGTP